MFKKIAILSGKIFLVFVIFVAHIWINNIFPYPFEHINLIFSFLFLYLLSDESGGVLWYGLILGLFLELFVSSTFGITILALFFCLLSTRWLLTYFLTNRSFYIIAFASSLSIFMYRIYFLGLNSLTNFFFKRNFLYTSRTTADYAYEIILTAIFTMIAYLIISQIIKKLNPRYVGHV